MKNRLLFLLVCCVLVLGPALPREGWCEPPNTSTPRVLPIRVVTASGRAFPHGAVAGNPPNPQYEAARAIDGDPATFCCLLDDTLGGELPGTIPARATEPVTGMMLFDLGRPVRVVGARLTSRKPGGPYNPKEVEFFHVAQGKLPPRSPPATSQEGKVDGAVPLKRHTYAALRAGQSEDVTWNGVIARYVGLEIRSSYESGGPVHYNFQIGEIEFYIDHVGGNLQSPPPSPSLYVKGETLPLTLLGCRKRYLAWYEGMRPAGSQTSGFWKKVRADFPDSSRLLELAGDAWFAPSGWFAHADDTVLERMLIDRVARETGSAGRFLRVRMESLFRAGAPPDDPRWLELCEEAANFAALNGDMGRVGAAVEDLARLFPERYPGKSFLGRFHDIERAAIEATRARREGPASPVRQVEARLARFKREAMVRANPLLPEKLLFVKRTTYSPGWYYAEFMRASRFGGNLCSLSLGDGSVTELVPQLAGGIFDRYDLSFDAKRVVFAYKAAPGKGFRLYEVGVDGTGLRQLTFDPPDEAQRVAKYWHPRNKPSGVYRHHTDDFHPCYLPDGRICFASTRCEQGVLCDQGDSLAVNVLYRIDADGGNLTRLSQGALSESTPSVTTDGRILYTRWEYVDKGVIAVQALWTMRPDGSASAEVYGNQIEHPPVLIHGRAIPGSNHRFVATATMHHPMAVGPIVRLDVRREIRTHEPIDSLTPDTNLNIDGVGGFPKGEKFMHLKNGRWVADNTGPLFSEPYPLADPATGAGAGNYFLVDCNPDRPWNDAAAYGLYLIDPFGNRVLLYDDPTISCWQPMPLRARRRPPELPSVEEVANEPSGPHAANPIDDDEAVLVMADVYEGLEGVKPGAVKHLRILEQVPRPWSARRFWPHDEAFGQHAVISLDGHIFVKIHHGVVPVRDDGSAHFIVPARKNLFFQALDEDYMEVQRMRSFVNLQPGERRSCIGCHERRRWAPPSKTPLALGFPPSRPRSQPGETVPRPIHYTSDIQPILDRHCVECHGGDRLEADLDLSGEPTSFFNRSYESLMKRKLVAYIQEFHGPQPRAQKTNAVTLPPYRLGSHASRLITLIQSGHYDAVLNPAEMVRLVTWADANAPYYGSYFGRRNLVYRTHADFRPTPTLLSAGGTLPK